MIGRNQLWRYRFKTLCQNASAAAISIVAISNMAISIIAGSIMLGCQADAWDPQQIRQAEAKLIEAQEAWQNHQPAVACQAVDWAIEQGGLSADQLTDAGLLRFECLLQLERFDEAHSQLQWLEKLDTSCPSLEEHHQRLRSQRESHRMRTHATPMDDAKELFNGRNPN